MKVADNRFEEKYIERIKKFPNQILDEHEYAIQQGFSYFASDKYKDKFIGKPPKGVKKKMIRDAIAGKAPLLGVFSNMLGTIRGMIQNFKDAEEYVVELEKTGRIVDESSICSESVWQELQKYAWDKHNVLIGFTEVPREYIFKRKALLFKYAIVCIQEMKEEAINKAPLIEASYEALRVYNSLGKATNDMTRWLKENHGIKCMACSPMGGLVDTVPLAQKAGLGGVGHNGLLITPQFGPRQRISVIFVNRPIFDFTDSKEHLWINEFCKNCRTCERKCEANAIYTNKIKNDTTGFVTSIDREKCYPYFSKTGGCGVCIKVCPFSKGNSSYEKIKDRYFSKEKKYIN
ncbi:4Fe-4S dicluster domain-containing protein [Clostridiaceae bacterium M8S5]|nr:4Fe-4S dicluster domain-containing protein [Clostridiaceae bacterium M8S5]